MNANCSYCNSKRHPTERCMVGKLPKKGEIKDWREDNNDYAMGWWQGIEAYKDSQKTKTTSSATLFNFLSDPKEDIYTLKDGKPINPPTITIKELSYLLSKARKDIKRSAWSESSNNVAEVVFRIIRKQLNLRKRGRK